MLLELLSFVHCVYIKPIPFDFFSNAMQMFIGEENKQARIAILPCL